ncbi:MAG: hypothetical protein GEV06_23340 [Luteitalea sp.]|nr:hypothetical protein [Luteitalea sp.]
MGERKNAIARRLDRLNDQWNEFASNSEARLLRWLVRDDELRVVEAFIQTEQDDRAGEIPDLFLSLVDPFEDVVSYGQVLRASLLSQYEEARPDLVAAGMDDAWLPPTPEGRHSLVAFLETCTSLRAHYNELTDKLALVLMPVSVSDDAEWQRWLGALVERLPEEVRVAVVDSIDRPVLIALAEGQPGRVATTVADLDMPSAILELSRTGGTSTPDGQFRVKFTALSQALAQGDLETARERADAATAIAKANNWTHLVAAVNMALAGGFLAAKRWTEAISLYQDAGAAGTRLKSDGDAVGSKLRLQAGLGHCAALFAAGDFRQAGATYEAAAVLATNAADGLMLVECWRMASYCHERAGDLARAWDCGLRALDAAEALPPENRAHSTLPFAGEGMLRLANMASAPSTHAEFVEQRLTDLMGTSQWRSVDAAAGDLG